MIATWKGLIQNYQASLTLISKQFTSLRQNWAWGCTLTLIKWIWRHHCNKLVPNRSRILQRARLSKSQSQWAWGCTLMLKIVNWQPELCSAWFQIKRCRWRETCRKKIWKGRTQRRRAPSGANGPSRLWKILSSKAKWPRRWKRSQSKTNRQSSIEKSLSQKRKSTTNWKNQNWAFPRSPTLSWRREQ